MKENEPFVPEGGWETAETSEPKTQVDNNLKKVGILMEAVLEGKMGAGNQVQVARDIYKAFVPSVFDKGEESFRQGVEAVKIFAQDYVQRCFEAWGRELNIPEEKRRELAGIGQTILVTSQLGRLLQGEVLALPEKSEV